MGWGFRLVGIAALSLWLTACATSPTPPAGRRAGPRLAREAPHQTASAQIVPPTAPTAAAADLRRSARLVARGSRRGAAGVSGRMRRGAGLQTCAVCLRARALTVADEAGARDFLEANFRPQRVGEHGLLTAYFAPEYEARATKEGPYTAPVREKPADLVMLELGPFDPSLAGKKVSGHIVGGAVHAPYFDRAEIEARPAKSPIAWMKPEELFFMQIQGSGVLKAAGRQADQSHLQRLQRQALRRHRRHIAQPRRTGRRRHLRRGHPRLAGRPPRAGSRGGDAAKPALRLLQGRP